MSRYDRPDPGTDPDYCDGLAPEYDEHEPSCFWCGQPYSELEHVPYCSTLCACCADIDTLLIDSWDGR